MERSKKIQKLMHRIYKKQSELDLLLNKLFELDDNAGAEVCERLKERDG